MQRARTISFQRTANMFGIEIYKFHVLSNNWGIYHFATRGDEQNSETSFVMSRASVALTVKYKS